MDQNTATESKPKHFVPRYLRTSAVKALIRSHGKRAGEEFLMALDTHVMLSVNRACAVHNGGKKTLDSTVAGYVGLK